MQDFAKSKFSEIKGGEWTHAPYGWNGQANYAGLVFLYIMYIIGILGIRCCIGFFICLPIYVHGISAYSG